jgi:hypothetical protein
MQICRVFVLSAYIQTDNQLASQPMAIEKTQTVKYCVGNPDPALG